MTENKEYELILSEGVEGPSVYLNDFRIAGPKPWGGGKTLARWTVSKADLLKAISDLDYKEKK